VQVVNNYGKEAREVFTARRPSSHPGCAQVSLTDSLAHDDEPGAASGTEAGGWTSRFSLWFYLRFYRLKSPSPAALGDRDISPYLRNPGIPIPDLRRFLRQPADDLGTGPGNGSDTGRGQVQWSLGARAGLRDAG
jgi:hypothetical protein